MKKYIFLSVMMSVTLTLSARTFYPGEKLYINTAQVIHDANYGDISSWTASSAKLFLYLFQKNGSNTLWLEMSPVSGATTIYEGTIPAKKDYDRVIVIRKSSSGTANNWNDRWHQTCDLEIPNYVDRNYMYTFYAKNNLGDQCDGQADWKVFTPGLSAVTSTISSVTQEEMHICPSALGGPLFLRCKLVNDGDEIAYDYNEVGAHTWLSSSNKTTWTSMDNYAGKKRDQEGNRDTLIALPATLPAGGIYYYLYSNIAAGRRLIHVVADAPKCELDCEITSFETAVSAVNADDSTYTLDGMVAFGAANGSLVIACDGHDTTIIAPKSPQTFSLRGVPAATVNGKTTKAYAYFSGSSDACRDSFVVKVPNVTESIQRVRLDSLTGKSFVLKPVNTEASNDYMWIVIDKNGNRTEYKKSEGQGQTFTVNAFSTDDSVTVIYKEYYPIVGNMNDLMKNGSYEDANTNYGTYGQKSAISDYDFWGYHPETGTENIQFYDTCSIPPEFDPTDPNVPLPLANGFAVVRNANNFYHSYAKVTAKDGNNFALIDAKTGEAGANMRAWHASTADNPDLKLKKGTTYVLSFWAANINNYGEMDNAAKFVFRIRNNTTGVEKDSKVLDLSLPEFRNNLWHQCSQTFLAEEDCDDVTISVVNLNNRKLSVGNDFALDDIQFHPISSVSRVVKSHQEFKIYAHEPKIDAFTATVQPVDCNGTDYIVAMHVAYQNPNGKLMIKDVTRDTIYEYNLPAGGFDTSYNLDRNILIKTKEPTHTWEAYFENWVTAKKTAVTTIPGFPSMDTTLTSFAPLGCTDLTTALSFNMRYTYQQGALHYTVTELTGDSTCTITTDKAEQYLNNLVFEGIPADGKVRHLRVWADGANSCDTTYTLPPTPYSTVISAMAVKAPKSVLCSTQKYIDTITITTPYDATGRNIVLSYEGRDTTIVATGTSTTVYAPMSTIGGSMTVEAVFEVAPNCTPVSTTFAAPKRISCIKEEVTICEGETYAWQGNTYSRPVGVDTITNPSNVNDTLILTVMSKPSIAVGKVDMTCDNANQIRVPFTVTNGTPNTFDVVVNGVQYVGTLDIIGMDTAFVFTPAMMQAGDYVATITVGEANSPCESTATVTYTIALSDQVYSKWTDVLFVSNKDGRYVAYQWYADGLVMPGETMQRMYNPNGLSGTQIEYSCRLTTTDGQTLYTCPVMFDNVQPSRSQTTGSGVQKRMVYDTMGHPVTGIPTKGIYIIVEQINGEIIARKWIVYE